MMDGTIVLTTTNLYTRKYFSNLAHTQLTTFMCSSLQQRMQAQFTSFNILNLIFLHQFLSVYPPDWF